MKFDYARVSTRDQNLDLQVDQLRQAGFELEAGSPPAGVRSCVKVEFPLCRVVPAPVA
jgi:predicted site-specific integrase-resolvase